MRSRSVTLEDVASAAGVSYQTVSRVLNHSDQVAEQTRKRVEAAMQALNYVPNRVAQQLAGKNTRTLGLATSDLALLAPAQIASAIQQRTSQLGYHLVIAMADEGGAQQAVSDLLSQRVDALLINVPLDALAAQQIERMAASLPCLFLDVADDANVASCSFSAHTGARQGAEHLLQLGHQRIALLNGPADSVAARARTAVWRQVLEEHHLTPFRQLEGDWSAQSGYLAVIQLTGQALPTGLLVANDQMALGAMQALHQMGVAVPAEVSVVGYDDTADSAWYQPPLTTVRQDMRHLGERSVQWLTGQLEQPCRQAPLPPFATDLVVRASTAAPRAAKRLAHPIATELRRLAQQLDNDVP
ncbi:LacI family DNA-binding transcriptional regulator [Erwinia persicina]|uniref:Lac repressor n=1 Tax=Erwinia persicina TaxID=55211 RepID=A0A4U3F769_9GAMM|nr:LacI family DNA-binding transcriptional regulator [Erwinia persicina]MBD8105547.1 substrate-binding domain-containing protein [Erwinia persicina]MBD8209687.1 substrate-binding domain-containing protein [Erwinia persicina]TKJ89321.1 lac repressor [Erwinia persicina]